MSRLRLVLLLLVVAALALALLAGVRPGSTDDLFVVLVQARNWLDGAGWRWEPDGPRLDACTSTLDLAWKTLWLWALPGDGIRAAWWATQVSYLAAVLGLAWQGLRWGGAGRSAWAGALAGAALALAPGLAEGTTYLLEAPWVALGATGCAALILVPARGSRAAEVALGLAALPLLFVRPELALLTLAVLAGRGVRAGRSTLPALVVAGMGLCGWLLLRQLWLGDWAPNSYRAKAAANPLLELHDGLAYLGAAARRPAAACALAGLVVGLAAAGRARAVGALGVVAVGLLVLSGGDSYLGLRLFLPVGVLGLAAAALALGEPGRVRRRAAALTLGAALAAQLLVAAPRLGSLPAMARAGAWREADFACEQATAARFAALDPPLRIAHLHQQALRWFAPDLAVLDLSGLTDRELARRPVEGPVTFGREALDVALEREVEVLFLDFVRARPFAYTERPLEFWLDDPTVRAQVFGRLDVAPYRDELLRAYRCATLPDLCGPGAHLNVLVRGSAAEALRRAGFVVRER